MTLKERIGKIIAGLKKIYPRAHCELDFSNPLELIVATVLSAQCTDKRVNLVTQTLFKKYRTAKDYAFASPSALEKEIRSTGFFRQKAKWIRQLCRKLIREHGGKVPRSMEKLTLLPGVARKTANVVLGNAYGIASGIVVDTHMKRLAYRMGLTQEEDPVKIEQDLVKLVLQKDWIWFSHAMIWHGRRVCKALSPNCPECILQSFCPKRGI